MKPDHWHPVSDTLFPHRARKPDEAELMRTDEAELLKRRFLKDKALGLNNIRRRQYYTCMPLHRAKDYQVTSVRTS